MSMNENEEKITGKGCNYIIYSSPIQPGCNVHFCHKEKETKEFVLKKIPLIKDSTNYKLCKREINIIRQLKHPNLVAIHATLKDKNYMYFVMEYYTKGDLEKYIKQKKEKNEKLSLLQIVSIFLDICEGYNELYQKKIIHR